MRCKRFYQGPIRLIEKELKVNYGSGRTIFIDHMIDLFADGIPDENIEKVLGHCRQYPDNTYVFQTRNPMRMQRLANDDDYNSRLPPSFIVGTTIETNREDLLQQYSKAPDTYWRRSGMSWLDEPKATFLTIEPIMAFDLEEFVKLIKHTQHTFINIGADSKNQNLPEPSRELTLNLIDELRKLNFDVRLKENLNRIIGPQMEFSR